MEDPMFDIEMDLQDVLEMIDEGKEESFLYNAVLNVIEKVQRIQVD